MMKLCLLEMLKNDETMCARNALEHNNVLGSLGNLIFPIHHNEDINSYIINININYAPPPCIMICV